GTPWRDAPGLWGTVISIARGRFVKDLMDAAMVGKALAGKSSQTGKRFMDKNCPIPVFKIKNRKYVSGADFERWLESTQQAPEVQNLKSMLKRTSDRVLEKQKMKKKKAAETASS